MKGEINLEGCEGVRVSQAPNADPLEIEVLTTARTYRLVRPPTSWGRRPAAVCSLPCAAWNETEAARDERWMRGAGGVSC